MHQQRHEDMKKRRSQERTTLCLLVWSCLEFALSDVLEVQPTIPGETSTQTVHSDAANGTSAQSNLSVIPKPLDKGFRVAVIASLISGVIIITMSISFTFCCLQDRMLWGRAQEGETSKVQRPRRKFKIGRAKSINQEMGKHRGHSGKPKHHHRLQYRTSALYSCAYPGALARCNNQGFQRGQENLQKAAPQSLYSEIHIFPQVVLKPSTVPSASMFVHLPQKPGAVPLNLTPSSRSLPQDLSSVHYGRSDGLSYLNKY
ncbi:hypothetical protein lerEdw1_003911 [Lerista edwardsae]|nr:hypothetical protein lerEdw1_003911 [Lerista edwardsae]